ncbi:MAG TPA: dihydroorotase [Rhodospirillaceae bacterium]|nr:dihydroorotase [Rhodospirillaceae bacterium]
MAVSSLTIPKPDDWHLHLRDGSLLKAVIPFTARHFARAIIMPNLTPPIVTSDQAKAYRERIRQALPEGMTFTPLMTAYLTDTTQPDDLKRGFEEGIFVAAKLYPAGSTTNAENGVTDVQAIAPLLETLQRIGMPLLIHGEIATPDVDFFDRETVFIDRVLIPLRRGFPELKIVLEHITTRHAVQYVASESQNSELAATITPHHLLLNRNALFKGGIRPHHFCLPVLKRETDRLSLIEAATSGAPMFFVGTDSAPHLRTTKESAQGAGGIFSAPTALSIYAEIFEKAGALEKLEAFLCLNGPLFYGLPLNAGSLTFEKEEPEALKPILTEENVEIIPFLPFMSESNSGLSWRVKEKEPL